MVEKKIETNLENKLEPEIYLNICTDKSLNNFNNNFLENDQDSVEELDSISKYSELLDINYTDKSDILNESKNSNNTSPFEYENDENKIKLNNNNNSTSNKNNLFNSKKRSSNKISTQEDSVKNNIPTNDFFQSELYYNILNKEKVKQTTKTK